LEPQHTRLANGAHALVVPMPWMHTIALSVFVRTGSVHEPRRLAGISHLVEHMAFKGTARRSCQQINLEAESRGAEVNAHTDKDHTAFHVEGLAGDLKRFLELLADIVGASTFPADELERERRVILEELAEHEDDPVALAFRLFDRACWGTHAAAQPVIGRRAVLERITREQLQAYVQGQYTAPNVVVAVAGAVDAGGFVRAVERHFGGLPEGEPNTVSAPRWRGGLATRRVSGSPQCQIVLGAPAPALADPAHVRHQLAAAWLGEGMSSPLLDTVRERLGIAYHAACSADVLPLAGQFVIEGATAPAQAEAFLDAAAALLQRGAETADAAGVERARQQLIVRAMRSRQQPWLQLEAAATDLFTLGRVRGAGERIEALQAPSAEDVRATFEARQRKRKALALAGAVTRRAREKGLQLAPAAD
jgi:predicted Zn-dependent peptidase